LGGLVLGFGFLWADLAPDIQQAILDLEPTTDQVPRFRECFVRQIAILPN
jgi:hypothetical protein